MNIRNTVRDSMRVFRRSPGFAAVVVLTLGLGIGANSAIFSIINGVLLKPLPYASGGDLVRVRMGAVGENVSPGDLSPLEVVDVRERAQALDRVLEYHTMFFNLLEQGRDPERVQVGVVSWDFFQSIGVQPIHGRAFSPEEDHIGAEPVLVLGYDYWLTRFGGDPDVVGRSVEMNNRPHLIVGVLPPVPTYPNLNDVWMPWYACPFRVGDGWHLNRQARSLLTVGRLAPGADVAMAEADLGRVSRDLFGEFGDAYPGVESVGASLVPLKDELTQGTRNTFLILMAMSGLVLLIACANVANMTLARVNQRRSELAIKTALGAGQRRIIGQLLGESLALSLAGAIVGTIMAFATVGLLAQWVESLTPRFNEITVDGGVLAFTVVIAVLAGLVVGAVPSLQMRGVTGELRGTKSSSGSGRSRVRSALVVVQVSVAFLLLAGSGLMVRSFQKLTSVDPGYDASGVLTLTIDLDWATYTTSADSRDFYRSLLERVRAQPRVTTAAVASDFPMSGATFQTQRNLTIDGRTLDAVPPRVNARFVSDGYFEALEIPLERGRYFQRSDDEGGAPVAVLSRAAATRHFGSTDPIGVSVSADGGQSWATVVGVVGDVRQTGFEADLNEEVYFPYAQSGPIGGFARRVLIDTDGDPMELARAVTEDVYAIDPDQPVSFVQALSDAESEVVASPRTIALLLTVFSLVAFVTAVAGIVSVVALSTSQRRREIGIRLALGGERRDVVLMVLRGGLTMTGIGLAIGGVLAVALGGALEGLLFGLDATDPATLLMVALTLLGTATLAILVPAWKGSKVDAIEAVRSE